MILFVLFQAEDGIRDLVRSRGSEMCIRDSQATVPTPLTHKAVGGIVNGAAYVFRASAFSPSAAGVAISGRALTAGGAGIRNARLTPVSYTHLTLPTSDLV